MDNSLLLLWQPSHLYIKLFYFISTVMGIELCDVMTVHNETRNYTKIDTVKDLTPVFYTNVLYADVIHWCF